MHKEWQKELIGMAERVRHYVKVFFDSNYKGKTFTANGKYYEIESAYRYLREEKRLCVVNYISMQPSGELYASITFYNKHTKKFDIRNHCLNSLDELELEQYNETPNRGGGEGEK